MKIFDKNERKLRINNQEIGIKVGTEKCIMLMTEKKEKELKELPNLKHLEKRKVRDISQQTKMKEKVRK